MRDVVDQAAFDHLGILLSKKDSPGMKEFGTRAIVYIQHAVSTPPSNSTWMPDGDGSVAQKKERWIIQKIGHRIKYPNLLYTAGCLGFFSLRTAVLESFRRRFVQTRGTQTRQRK